jgi:hypothetical protein
MANSGNLKPIRTKSEAREKGKKGGEKSGESRRERKKLKELLELCLQLNDEEIGFKNDYAMTVALIKKAVKGDVSAYLAIRDTLGEKPIDKQEVKINPITIKDDI